MASPGRPETLSIPSLSPTRDSRSPSPPPSLRARPNGRAFGLSRQPLDLRRGGGGARGELLVRRVNASAWLHNHRGTNNMLFRLDERRAALRRAKANIVERIVHLLREDREINGYVGEYETLRAGSQSMVERVAHDLSRVPDLAIVRDVMPEPVVPPTETVYIDRNMTFGIRI